jgi:hypothetical protein
MEIPEYISKAEVQRVCQQLGIRDWTLLSAPQVELREAEIIRKEVGAEALEISVEDYKAGLEVELEHGVTFPDANVTNNHPILTGKIVLAHLKETLDYYQRLDIAEIEGDILKALLSGDLEKLSAKQKKLVAAKAVLVELENRQLRRG